MPSAPSHSANVNYQNRRNCLVQWFGVALVLLPVLVFVSPLLFAACLLIVMGLTGFIIIDGLRRNSHFHRCRNEGTVAGLTRWGMALCGLGLLCWLAGNGLLLLDQAVLGGFAHEEPRVFSFATAPLQRAIESAWQLLGIAGIGGLLLFGLLLWAWWKNIKEQRPLARLAAGSCIIFLTTVGALLWLTAKLPAFQRDRSCVLHIQHTFNASDGHTYYLLQSEGDSSHGTHSIIAKHIGSSMLTDRLQTVTPYYGDGDVRAVLRQGFTERDPQVRKLCRMLEKSLELGS